MKTTYPPLATIQQWRDSGLSPEQVHARCVAWDKAVRRSNRKCVICGDKYHASGNCAKHYYKWYMGKL